MVPAYITCHPPPRFGRLGVLDSCYCGETNKVLTGHLLQVLTQRLIRIDHAHIIPGIGGKAHTFNGG